MGCILKSKKPSEMLVMRPTKSELVMNVKGGRNDENSGETYLSVRWWPCSLCPVARWRKLRVMQRRA